ncbi:phage virion morphogenesis protein [uncultured Gilvimarinus sp.]|uniref:phage virion morphogenesis protein n=1 Tax=uncultured Gilvimarinus sp. TaxID=1689143 RepID=UPI0030DBCC79
MAGVKVEITSDVAPKLRGLIDGLEHPAPLFGQINEYLLRSTRARFKTQTSPSGVPWAPLSPAYKKRKRRNSNRILVLNGYLSGTLRGQHDDEGLEFGSDRVYAAIQQLGGTIKRKASKRDVYFKQNRDGSVGNRFVKKSKSNFAQSVNVGSYEIKIPSREFLGTNEKDDKHIIKLAQRFLKNTMQ